MNETTNATRGLFRLILRRLTILVVVLAAGGGVVGHLLAGPPGLWGALMGAGVAALFMIGTVGTMLVTADKSIYAASAAGMGGWLVKIVLLFVALLLIRDKGFYSPEAFFVVLVLAVLGSMAIEVGAILRARIPTVEAPAPAPRETDEP